MVSGCGFRSELLCSFFFHLAGRSGGLRAPGSHTQRVPGVAPENLLFAGVGRQRRPTPAKKAFLGGLAALQTSRPGVTAKKAFLGGLAALQTSRRGATAYIVSMSLLTEIELDCSANVACAGARYTCDTNYQVSRSESRVGYHR